MKMTKLEKMFVNRRKEAEKNIEIAEQLFSQIDLSNTKKALEVGCGIGVLSSYLAKKYKWDLTGIDLDPEQIERARKDNTEDENLRFFEADVTKLPFADSEFDMVLSFDVLHHIPNWDKALNKISRVLRPEGYYVLNDLALPKFLRIFGGLAKSSGGFFAVDDIISHLKRNRFEVIYEKKQKINIFAGLVGHFSIVSQIVQPSIVR